MSSIRAARRRVRSQILGALFLVIATSTSIVGRGTALASPDEPAIVREDEARGATTLLEWANGVRRRHDLRPLRMAARVARYAQRHSALMAQQGRLFHSTGAQLTDALGERGWRRCGENVGRSTTLARVERAFLRSAEHRANVLDPAFDRAGIGVVRTYGRTWVTLVVYG